jgi:O-acetyl-ADP-ribose deacetylase (regulator of RNase III)
VSSNRVFSTLAENALITWVFFQLSHQIHYRLVCLLLVQSGSWSSNGLAVTSGGNMSCKYIFHIAADVTGWSDGIKSCLQEAENRKMNSISFPLLGTGNAVFIVL